MRRVILALLLVAAPVSAQRIGVGVGLTLGGGGTGGASMPTAPVVSNLSGAIAGDAAIGSAIVTPVVAGL